MAFWVCQLGAYVTVGSQECHTTQTPEILKLLMKKLRHQEGDKYWSQIQGDKTWIHIITYIPKTTATQLMNPLDLLWPSHTQVQACSVLHHSLLLGINSEGKTNPSGSHRRDGEWGNLVNPPSWKSNWVCVAGLAREGQQRWSNCG